jgi:N,N'-diacetyllegionaminate synthase
MNTGVFIIAELAQGFEGNYEQARLLIRASAAAGADAAKFQLVYADELATPDYKYYDLFRSLEMSDSDWQKLADYAKELNIELYLDIFGNASLQLASQIGVRCIKLHGTDISNIGLLHAVAASSIQKIILGAGGAYLSEIGNALTILENKEVVILLGFQGYPTPDETNQVARLPLLKSYLEKKYTNATLGFADHADPVSPLRYAITVAAIGAGAAVIEKHLTLGRNMKLEDHESALNPDEFLEFTGVVRHCDKAMGNASLSEDFSMSEPEKAYRLLIRRHAVAARDLAKDTVIKPADLVLKRTSAGEVITDLALLYGKKLTRNVAANGAILKPDIDQAI